MSRMLTLWSQVIGVAAFTLATLVLGVQMRRTPTKEAAHRLSRISHTFFWLAFFAPAFAGIITPGLTHFDALLGLPSLPWPVARWVLGVPLVLVGGYCASSSMRALKVRGAGMMAFQLTQQVVDTQVYERVRNPMSLGLYLQFVGVSLLVGSTWLLFASVVLYIPAHAFNLKFFEERELSARHGPSYDAYRARVPFLVPRLHAPKVAAR
jgi:protein-S-isoprenylcysteine O-methyltransferase Ste14